MTRLAPLLLLLAALAARAEDVDDVINDASVAELFADARAAVERETGAKLDPAPAAKIATAAEVAAILVDELAPQMPLLQPGADAEACRATARQMADLFASGLMGKYAPATDTFYVVRENFPTLASLYHRPDLISRDSLRTVMIHELAHAADQKRFHAFDRIRELRTFEELQAWNAVLEGHAQYVTKKALSREDGGEKRFEDFCSIVATVPPGTQEGLKQVLEVLNAASHFAYHDGLRFFVTLEESEKGDFVARVFEKPPVRRGQILHPEQWVHPEEAPKLRDLAALWDGVKKDAGEDWTAQVVPIGEVELRAASGDFVAKEKVDALIRSCRGGSALVLNSKSAPGMKQMMVLVVEMEDEQAAGAFLEFNGALLKAKDERFRDGAIQIKDAKYGALALKGGQRSLDARKTVAAMGNETKIRDATIVVGTYGVEMMWSGLSPKKKSVEARAEKIVEFLEKE